MEPMERSTNVLHLAQLERDASLLMFIPYHDRITDTLLCFFL